ncbi:hypothetical protein QQM39_26825 [Streptomyces sp. DT2A-34]|uniref:hypothetical protein n=1 Tax=Streptomyces sp. DT2A-34 TaxID=3051182 RepID=UPI00265C132E|nr:hypothetical protein [Streptomyces sp. DT2A-34]MDO0914312.1 hypothetical protein [Streptomyces sp. DT2A-34]
MTIPSDQAVRIQLVRIAITRFAPIIRAGISSEWDDAVLDHPSSQELAERLSAMEDLSVPVGIDEVEEVQDSLGELLDLFDEEPMGSTYYPFKAAELIELHCRMATGDLPDDAPVPLAEWVDRFAGHVDWQLEKSGVDLGRPKHFSGLERSLREKQSSLTGRDNSSFREFIEDSREVGIQYVSALNSALR